MTHVGYFLLIAAVVNTFLALKEGIIAEDCNWATLQVRFVTQNVFEHLTDLYSAPP
jgi:hypothetical protein